MPRKSAYRYKSKRQSRSRSRSRSQSQSRSQYQNQSGGSNVTAPATMPAGGVQISSQVLQQAGDMAKGLIDKAMANQNQSGGGSLQGTELSAATDAAGLKTAMVGGAVAGAVAGADTYSSLKGSAIVGGKKRRGRGRQSQSQSQSQSQNQSQNQSQSQKGGMVPGLLTAVETALVPLGLYLGQKALQSRGRSGSRSLGKSFDFRRASRRTRRRR